MQDRRVGKLYIHYAVTPLVPYFHYVHMYQFTLCWSPTHDGFSYLTRQNTKLTERRGRQGYSKWNLACVCAHTKETELDCKASQTEGTCFKNPFLQSWEISRKQLHAASLRYCSQGIWKDWLRFFSFRACQASSRAEFCAWSRRSLQTSEWSNE